jgi:AhpD family alkylhydroperoxidase
MRSNGFPLFGGRRCTVTKSHKESANDVSSGVGLLREALPEAMKGFAELATASTAHRELDTKTKELMAVAIGIAIQCEGCIDIHTKLAHRHGATRQQMAETIALAIYMGGGPASVYGAKALRAYDEFNGAAVALENEFIT